MSERDALNVLDVVRRHAEEEFAEELEQLAAVDRRARPPSWRLSPWAVTEYVLGTHLDNGFEISPKYIGDRRLVEVAVATLATDRALLLLGLPGARRLMDEFDIQSEVGRGTTVTMKKWMQSRSARVS